VILFKVFRYALLCGHFKNMKSLEIYFLRCNKMESLPHNTVEKTSCKRFNVLIFYRYVDFIYNYLILYGCADFICGVLLVMEFVLE